MTEDRRGWLVHSTPRHSRAAWIAHLNVAAILEGTLRRFGNRLRITAEFIHAGSGYQLWSEREELLHFFVFPRHLWRKQRTTNVIESCLVEVRRRTRPMVVFTNVESVDRIIYAIFSRFNEDWKTHTLKLFTQAA